MSRAGRLNIRTATNYLLPCTLQRFVLAEILKSSDVGVEHLWQFIKANQIVPDWMNMQVPLGTYSLFAIGQDIHLSENFSLMLRQVAV